MNGETINKQPNKNIQPFNYTPLKLADTGIYTAKATVISLISPGVELGRMAKILQKPYAFPQNFHTSKLGKTSVFWQKLSNLSLNLGNGGER